MDTKTYDFGLGWPIPDDKDDLFIQTLESECKLHNLSFIVVDDRFLDNLDSQVQNHQIAIKFFLDMASEVFDPEDKFSRFIYALKDAGCKVVDDPDDVKHAADKSITHFELLKYHIPVPETVVIRQWQPTRTLTPDEQAKIGIPFIIKPANGYARQGVQVIGQSHTLEDIERVREDSDCDTFLLQKLIEPADLDGSPAWFRIYHIFGEITPCWWHPDTHIYRQLTLKETDKYKLLPIARLTAEIAQVTRVEWFSSEIAQDKNGNFFAIDYMNDQCSMYPQSHAKDGVPDDLVIQIARRTVEKAYRYIKGQPVLTYPAIWFPQVKIVDDNI